MKYIKKYNKLFESNEIEEKVEVDNIIDAMLDIIDEYSNVIFDSNYGSMRFNDYKERNDKYQSFNPTFKSGNKIRSRFSIQFYSIKGYEKFNWIVSEMSSVIGRLNDFGWILQDMKLGKVSDSEENNVSFSELTYKFIKPDVIINSDLPKAQEIMDVFNKNTQLLTSLSEIEIHDKYVDIGFDSKTYDGDIPEDIEDQLLKVAELLGFGEEFERGRADWGVRYWYD